MTGKMLSGEQGYKLFYGGKMMGGGEAAIALASCDKCEFADSKMESCFDTVTKTENCSISAALIAAARELSLQVNRLKFRSPVSHVYNPLAYAWQPHEEYLRRFGGNRKRVIFLGMNPGPFGMAQVGIPFGEIAAVRDWLGIRAHVGKPDTEHPGLPILGFDCPRSEVSGHRFWKLFSERFGTPEQYFEEHFVVNYCPLAFCKDGKKGKTSNQTPDKLPAGEQQKLFAVCDEHLRRVLEILEPEWLIGVGGFALERGEVASEKVKVKLGKILHPSPASPAANRGWPQAVTRQLVELGVWT